MASPGLELEGNQHQHQHQDASPEPAFLEAQKWIEAVTGRCFGEKSFRSGLENGILLCELLNSIKPGLVKKINRLPTPLAGLDNIILFLRGCEGLGLKGTQLFDPGDLQDTSNRANIKGSDCCRKLKNVLITIYWLGKAANSCASYSGATLNLKEFEGLLSQMRKEAEDLESPKHSIRDSGYIDCWDSERSDSLSPPRHGRDDSFDSLDSFGSRSHHTPSPDVVILGSSDGRGSDSESDMPHRRMPDMRKDDMLARRTSYNEPRSAMPFNQYLPNKSNLTAYVPTPLRKKAAERQEYRKSWSTATSPIGGERPFSHPETIEEEYCETSVCYEDDGMARAEQEAGHRAAKSRVDNVQYQEIGRGHSQTDRPKESLPHKWEGKDEEEVKRLQRLEKAAVRVLPTSVRYSRPDSEESQPAPPDIILRRDNDFLKCQQEGESDSEDKEQEQRLPDIEKDDLASRKARMNQFKPKVPHNTFLPMPCSQRDEEKWENIKKATHLVTRSPLDRQQGVTSSSALSSPVDQYRQATPVVLTTVTVTTKECPQTTRKCLQLSKREMEKEEQEEEVAKESFPDLEKDDMMTRRALAIHRQRATAASQFLPVPASRQAWPSEASRDGKPRRRPSWLDDDLPPIYSHTASVSDDADYLSTLLPVRAARSVSMIDMRCEDEAILQPHSKARHEHLHDLHNRLLEEDDKWQDDLVRWKNRRRSASQDLIKKEEERKKVERLMSGDRDLSERRKSIKTYREIVEEKERRERELHEAYRNASSPEEAEAILRRYTQRFTVSEAVLERLEMPKFLERSVSVDSDTPSSPTKEASNPMKYLRQKSLPAPKFTATVEATISVEPQPQVSPPQTSPTRTVSTKAVPMLSPKPYSQPKNTQPALKSFKVDGMVRVNGETGEAFNGAEDERESASVKISLTKSQVMESADGANTSPVDTVIHTSPFKSQENAMVNTSPLESKVDASAAKSPEQPGTHISPVNSEEGTFGKDPAPAKPTSLPTDPCRENLVSEKQDKKETETSQKDEEHVVQALETQSRSVESSVVTQQSDADSKNFPREGHLNMPESMNCQSTVVLNTVQYSLTTKQPEQEMEDGFDSVASEKRQVTLPEIQTSYLPAEEDSGPSEENSNTPAPPFTLPKRNDYWSWDPEEERKRQERWQQEQERLLQEKYQREQDKLKQEWERAQKEVEEEERRYHEEERKILEETVAPLTPRSSTLSSPSRSDQPLLPLDPEGAIVRSLADWEHKQELLEKQAQRSKAEGCEKDEKQRETTDQPAIANEQEPTVKADEQVKVTESSHICHTETLAQSQQNDQKLLSDNSQSAVSELQFIPDASWNNKQLCTKQPEEVWRKTASLDRNWSQTSVTGGMKRSGSYENLGTTPSKSSPCSPNLQTQSPNRSISGKKVCSSCSQPLGKGAAMIIETLGLYFHIQCFKCGICNGQLGDTSTGTDVRIRNGILNCTECYIRSRTAGQPTTL
ncbi:LIM and calponin homology domains-containing protein 1a isoform X2 [Acipenser ruthenus]|uniref:LIM and calponin homology domains-containing protein 1a isoform X2 n=1 Tax=Acipenser ruthenus TaxID=7906 RepID=UPI0027426D48|nr:LIM and calponin homology domains-containing protein 1a isoform X2 [Acipenser ruthenus]